MSSILASLLPTLITTGAQLAPYVIDSISNIISHFTGNGVYLDSNAPGDLLSLPRPFAGIDMSRIGNAAVTPEDAASEQILSESIGKSAQEALRNVLVQKSLREALMMESFVNIKGTTIKLFTQYSFYYVNKPTSEIINPKKNNMPQIGYDDFAFIHIIPNVFEQWQKLRNWEFFYVDAVEVKEAINSEGTTSTQIAFFPFTRDVTKVRQSEALTSYNLSGQTNKIGVRYAIRNFSPAIMEYEEDGKFHPTNYECRPNLPYHSEVLNDFDSNRVEGSKFLSYGTVCFIKKNMGENDIAVQFNVELTVRVFNQSSTYIPPEEITPVSQEVYEKKTSKISNIIPKKVVKK